MFFGVAVPMTTVVCGPSEPEPWPSMRLEPEEVAFLSPDISKKMIVGEHPESHFLLGGFLSFATDGSYKPLCR